MGPESARSVNDPQASNETSVEAPPIVPPPVVNAWPHVPFDCDGRIAVDLPCSVCNYSLRGLMLHGACPECGTIAELNLDSRRLIFADARWLGQLKCGAALLMAAVIATIATTLSTVILSQVLFNAGISQSYQYIAWGNFLIGIIVAALTILGVWLLTSHDPARPLEMGSLRTFARIMFVVAEIASFVSTFVFASYASGRGAVALSYVWLNAAQVLSLAAAVLNPIAIFLLFTIARHLVLRLPDERLTRHASLVKWGLCSSLALMALMSVIRVVLQEVFGISPAGTLYRTIVWPMLYCPTLIFGAMTIAQLVRFRKRLAAAKRVSELMRTPPKNA